MSRATHPRARKRRDFDREHPALLSPRIVEAPRRRLGGLGAVFFMASLGALAFYVQKQAIPEEHDAIRTRATALPQAISEAPTRALPWQDRLDLASFKPVEVSDKVSAPAGRAACMA